MPIDVYLEIGAKRVFACAVDWPGWARAGRDEEAALEALAVYADRYRPVAAAAGLRFPRSVSPVVTERVKGSATTDFGAPGAVAAVDAPPLTRARGRRLATLVEAAWAVLDDAAAGAPKSLRKGPRGGGRDRDAVVAHVAEAQRSYAGMIGVRPEPADEATVRAAILEALRGAVEPEPGPRGGKRWPLRYAARRIAWHALDHAWEIQDRS